MFFTTKGPTVGTMLLEWNIAADVRGSAALWDCYVRIGSTTRTGLTPAEYPASGIIPGCKAASLIIYIKPGTLGYFENI